MALKTTKHGLGRGMDALLGDDFNSGSDTAPAAAGSDVDAASSAAGDASDAAAAADITADKIGVQGTLMLPLDSLKANAEQPRKYFDDEALQELAASIREHGIIQPIIAEEDGGGAYIIVAGERRFRAAGIAGLTEVPVIVRSYPGAQRLMVSLIENIHRADLNPVEEAEAYKSLMEVSGLSQEDVATRVGKNRSTVANALRLLKLPSEARESLISGGISSGHARAILAVTAVENQKRLFREIVKTGISVREAEKRAALLNGLSGEDKGKKPAPAETDAGKKRPPEITAMEEKFIGALRTKVAVAGDLNRGTIHIDYYSMEDLERLYEILGG